jgi:hypothetical protein
VADYKIAILQPVDPELFATNKRFIAGSIKFTGLRIFFMLSVAIQLRDDESFTVVRQI